MVVATNCSHSAQQHFLCGRSIPGIEDEDVQTYQVRPLVLEDVCCEHSISVNGRAWLLSIALVANLATLSTRLLLKSEEMILFLNLVSTDASWHVAATVAAGVAVGQ